jgi:hypothetical protein
MGSRARESSEAIMSVLSAGVTASIQPVPQNIAHGSMGVAQPGLHDRTAPMDAPGSEQVSAHRLVHLENKIRTALKQRRTVYESERVLLERACCQLDSGAGQLDAPTLAQACLQVIPCMHH